ncbi:MAG: hypothetical protein CMJ50_06055 [Planctomycetaceae bacterium]|nr:hypothetical protein [Planctomycetaceae bacterium]
MKKHQRSFVSLLTALSFVVLARRAKKVGRTLTLWFHCILMHLAVEYLGRRRWRQGFAKPHAHCVGPANFARASKVSKHVALIDVIVF